MFKGTQIQTIHLLNHRKGKAKVDDLQSEPQIA